MYNISYVKRNCNATNYNQYNKGVNCLLISIQCIMLYAHLEPNLYVKFTSPSVNMLWYCYIQLSKKIVCFKLVSTILLSILACRASQISKQLLLRI